MYLFCGYMPIEKFELFNAKMMENGSDLMEPSNLIIYWEAKHHKVTNCASGDNFDGSGWPYSEVAILKTPSICLNSEIYGKEMGCGDC
jgi:hypothetical protein